MRLKLYLSVVLLLVVSGVAWSLYSRNANASKRTPTTIKSDVPDVALEAVSFASGEDAATQTVNFTLVNNSGKPIHFFELAGQVKGNETVAYGFYKSPVRPFKAGERVQLKTAVDARLAPGNIRLRTVVFDDGSYIGEERIGITINAERNERDQLAEEFRGRVLALGTADNKAYPALSEQLKRQINEEIKILPRPEHPYAKDNQALASQLGSMNRVRALSELFAKVQQMDQIYQINQGSRSATAQEALEYLRRYSAGGVQ